MTIAARKKPAPAPPLPVPDYDLPDFPRRMDKTEQNEEDGITLRDKPDKPASSVQVSIGTYQELRPEPTKLDFLPPKRHSTSPAGARQPDGVIKNQLHSELSQTLSRARLRQRIPSTDLELSEEVKSKPSTEVNPTVGSKEDMPNVKNRSVPQQPPVLSTFRRAPSSEIQAKMASLAAASANGSSRDSTISQSADNKVTIKVHPYVSRTDFGQT